jgi:GT2 family glycosyltransferase
VVLLLNSDTLNEDNAIENCYRQFISSHYIACGVQLLNADRSPQISGNYFMTGGLNYLLPVPYLGNFIKWLGNLVKVEKPNVPDSNALIEVDWINGAFLMVKKTSIDKAGLLDEDFFLYAEEAEWCSRLHKTGKLCIYGQYKVIHLQGESANEAFGSSGKGYYNLYDRKGLQIMLSNFVRIRKQFGAGWFLLQLAVYTFAVPLFFIGSFVENCFRLRNPFSDFTMAVRFGLNVGRIWRFMPVILSNKPYFYKVL